MNKYETNLMSEFYSEDSFKRLRAYFGHVVRGNDVDYRTPLFNGKPREKVLDEWQPILEAKLKGMEGLLKFEDDLRSKVGPLSIMKPLSERWDDIKAYYSSIHLKSKPVSLEARDALIKDWRRSIGGLRLKSISATWEEMKKSTSSGSPYFTKRRDVFERTLPAMLQDMRLHQSDGIWRACATLGWRGQEGGPEDDDVKQRVIWMFPMGVNIQELREYQPLISACQRFNLIPAWNGNEYVDKEITALFDTKGKDDVIIATDFTKFDQHFNKNMQDCALSVLDALNTHDAEWDYWKKEVFPVKYEIPLMCNWDEVKEGSHGMGSGSGGTNGDETLSHKCLQHESAITSKSELNPHSQALGDDGCLTFPGLREVSQVIEPYTSHGQEMNEDKQGVSKDEVVYLRRWFSDELRVDGISHGVYSTYRALGKLMGQERFYDPDEWGPEMLVMRSLSIIENCKWHPAKDEFLEFCVKGDKFRLGLDIPGFFERLEHLFESSELAQSFGSYTDQGRAGINDWWCVKALKAMR